MFGRTKTHRFLQVFFFIINKFRRWQEKDMFFFLNASWNSVAGSFSFKGWKMKPWAYHRQRRSSLTTAGTVEETHTLESLKGKPKVLSFWSMAYEPIFSYFFPGHVCFSRITSWLTFETYFWGVRKWCHWNPYPKKPRDLPLKKKNTHSLASWSGSGSTNRFKDVGG